MLKLIYAKENLKEPLEQNQIKRLIAAHKELRQQQLLSELGSRMKLDWAWGVYSGDYYPRVLNINIPPACKMGDLVANQVFGL